MNRKRYINQFYTNNVAGSAVGYALDQAGALLRAKGVRQALLEISGDYLVLGTPEAGSWEIGLVDPRYPTRIAQSVHICDQALATSGNYRSNGHILDPHTGLPAAAEGSCTVIANSAADADCWSTGLFASKGTDANIPSEIRPIWL